jgi:hypothetical protein
LYFFVASCGACCKVQDVVRFAVGAVVGGIGGTKLGWLCLGVFYFSRLLTLLGVLPSFHCSNSLSVSLHSSIKHAFVCTRLAKLNDEFGVVPVSLGLYINLLFGLEKL